MISEPIIEALVIDFNIDAETAADRFFSSKTFAQLSDDATDLYMKPWQEVYEILKIELTK